MNSLLRYIEPGCDKYIIDSDELEKQYNEACDWISNLGFEYRKNRFGIYKQDIEKFLNNGKVESPSEELKRFFNAHLEANELIRLKNSFMNFDCSEILETIKKSVSGQRFRNASKTDQSRDFAFELGVASRFINAGYNVDLRTISDLVVKIDDITLFVECKRIKSIQQLEKRVKEANTQISNRISVNTSSKARGLIALNLTDIINPEAMPIISTSVEEYRNASAETLKSFVLQHRDTLSKHKSNKCLGVFTEFSTQGVIRNVSSTHRLDLKN